MKELLLFQVGRIHLALNLTLVSDIQSAKTIVAKQPQGSKCVAQMLNGQESLIYDLSAIFEQQVVGLESAHRKLIMVKTDKFSLGLVVDGVDKVVSADSSRIEPLSRMFKGASLSCFPSVLQYDDGLFLILSPEGIANIAPQMTAPQDDPDGGNRVDASLLTEDDNLAAKA